jgi:hypothetical protein
MRFRFLPILAIVVATALAPVGALGFAAGGDARADRRGQPRDAGSGWREAKRVDPKAEAAKKDAAKKDAAKKESAKPADKSGDAKKSGKPVQVGSYGDWGAFLAEGAKDKTCYALTTPKERAPAKLKRDPAYVFISTRPSEKVRNEVSIIMGFSMKDGGEARADIGGSNFDLIAKGANAWIKNPAEEGQFIDALKKGAKLIVKAPSLKGNVTTDTYSLSGISEALDRVQKDCQ